MSFQGPELAGKRLMPMATVDPKRTYEELEAGNVRWAAVQRLGLPRDQQSEDRWRTIPQPILLPADEASKQCAKGYGVTGKSVAPA